VKSISDRFCYNQSVTWSFLSLSTAFSRTTGVGADGHKTLSAKILKILGWKIDRFFHCSSESNAPKATLNNTGAVQAPAGKGCPRCGGVVYAAEQVLAKGRVSN